MGGRWRSLIRPNWASAGVLGGYETSAIAAGQSPRGRQEASAVSSFCRRPGSDMIRPQKETSPPWRFCSSPARSRLRSLYSSRFRWRQRRPDYEPAISCCLLCSYLLRCSPRASRLSARDSGGTSGETHRHEAERVPHSPIGPLQTGLSPPTGHIPYEIIHLDDASPQEV